MFSEVCRPTHERHVPRHPYSVGGPADDAFANPAIRGQEKHLARFLFPFSSNLSLPAPLAFADEIKGGDARYSDPLRCRKCATGEEKVPRPLSSVRAVILPIQTLLTQRVLLYYHYQSWRPPHKWIRLLHGRNPHCQRRPKLQLLVLLQTLADSLQHWLALLQPLPTTRSIPHRVEQSAHQSVLFLAV